MSIYMKKQNSFMREVEKIRKLSKTSTRVFADMCQIHPSRYCNLKFGRTEMTQKELSGIQWGIAGLEVELEYKDVLNKGGII